MNARTILVTTTVLALMVLGLGARYTDCDTRPVPAPAKTVPCTHVLAPGASC